MTPDDVRALAAAAVGIVGLTLLALVIARAEAKEPRLKDKPLNSRPAAAVSSVAFGAALVAAGVFTADSPDVETFLVGLGASILGAGVVAILSL